MYANGDDEGFIENMDGGLKTVMSVSAMRGSILGGGIAFGRIAEQIYVSDSPDPEGEELKQCSLPGCSLQLESTSLMKCSHCNTKFGKLKQGNALYSRGNTKFGKLKQGNAFLFLNNLMND